MSLTIIVKMLTGLVLSNENWQEASDSDTKYLNR